MELTTVCTLNDTKGPPTHEMRGKLVCDFHWILDWIVNYIPDLG